MSEQNDCEDQGFSDISAGCNACAPEFVNGKPVYPKILPDGPWLKCVKCKGSYGSNPAYKPCPDEAACIRADRCLAKCSQPDEAHASYP